MDLHLIILIAIMLFIGAFGGLLNYLNDFDTLQNEKKIAKTRSKYILLGIGAAFLMPLFLKMIESNIIRSRDNLDYLLFAGFCLIASIFSRRFISSIGDKILEVAKSAQKAALESKIKSEKTRRELLSTQERVENVKLAVDLSHTNKNILSVSNDKEKANLIALASSYVDKTSLPDYEERVKLKAELGRRMGEMVLSNQLVKEEILREHPSEGMRVALAYAIQLRPMAGDLEVLHQIALQAEQLHTRYAILLAYDTLARNRMIPNEQMKQTINVMEDFSEKADGSLLVKIKESRRIIGLMDNYR